MVTEINKSEALSILDSIIAGEIVKAEIGDTDVNLKEQTEESKEEVPDSVKEEEKERIKKGIDSLIEKGMISDALAYGYGSGNEPFKFTKTGKEIKDTLPGIVNALSLQKGIMQSKMAEIQSQIGVAPTVNYASSMVTDIQFMRYAYELTDAPYDEIARKYGDPTEQNLQCQQYNSLAYMLRDICEDITACGVIIANCEDSKKYTLSVSQLVALGFIGSPIAKSENSFRAFSSQGTENHVNLQKQRIYSAYLKDTDDKG